MSDVPKDPIGASLLRSEDEPLLRGTAAFIADVNPFPNPAAVFFVRSTAAHAHLLSVEVEAARNADGVLGVFVEADLGVCIPGPHSPDFDAVYAQPLLALGKVRHVGEPIVAVVAESLEQAVDAAEFVDIEYDELGVVVDPRQARLDDVLLFDERADGSTPTNVVVRSGSVFEESEASGSGSGSEAADSPEILVRLAMENPRQMPAPIEARGVVCAWIDGELWVEAATQTPHSFKKMLATIYGLDSEHVHVRTPWVGGGFGGKTTRSAEERVLPELSRHVGRPLRWIEDRSSYMASATQGRGEYITVELHGTSDGDLERLRVHLIKDAGAYPGVGAVLPDAYSRPLAAGAYRIGDVLFSSEAVATNTPQVGAFRGAGRAPMIAALERAVDVFAARAQLDPADLRRRNLLSADELPYETPTGGQYDAADYPGDFETLLRLADYAGLREEQQRRRSAGDQVQLGLGLACYLLNTSGAGGEAASITVHPDASATVVTGSTSQGHGHATVWAQIASATLGIDQSKIHVVEGNTDRIATGNGAVGSRSVQTAAPAIRSAAEVLVERARAVAARQLEASAEDIVLDVGSGQFHVAGVPSVGLDWAAVVEAAAPEDLDDETGEFECGAVFDAGRGAVPSGSHLAVVEVDTQTGAVTVVRFVAVDDAGVRINPMLVEGQLHGGIATGIGQALGEAMIYDEYGTPLTSNFMDYPVASIDQMPQFELHAAAVATDLNALGAKAVGESGPVGATAAVHNAVIDALGYFGVEHVDLPLTAERVWRAIAASTPGADGR